jgi:hypothetical protein
MANCLLEKGQFTKLDEERIRYEVEQRTSILLDGLQLMERWF